MPKFRGRYFTPARRAYWSLALLRIALGAFFLYDGYVKLNDPYFAVRLPSMLESWAANNPIFFYQDLLHGVIIPNGWFFAKLVVYGELILGVGYILGLAMPLMIGLQVFLNLNFMMAAQHTHPSELIANGACLLMALALLMGRAGYHYGLDRWMWPLISPWLSWDRLLGAKKRQRRGKTSWSRRSRKKSRPVVIEDDVDGMEESAQEQDAEDEEIDLVNLAELEEKRGRRRKGKKRTGLF